MNHENDQVSFLWHPQTRHPVLDKSSPSVLLSYDRLMKFHLSYKSGKAVYQQIVDQVRVAAASGALQVGDALPSIRPLAEELRVNRNTVAKAYEELERTGIIETFQGKGCFVKAADSPLRKDVRRRLVAERLDDAVSHAHHQQIDRDDFLRLAADRFDAFDRSRVAHAPHLNARK